MDQLVGIGVDEENVAGLDGVIAISGGIFKQEFIKSELEGIAI